MNFDKEIVKAIEDQEDLDWKDNQACIEAAAYADSKLDGPMLPIHVDGSEILIQSEQHEMLEMASFDKLEISKPGESFDYHASVDTAMKKQFLKTDTLLTGRSILMFPSCSPCQKDFSTMLSILYQVNGERDIFRVSGSFLQAISTEHSDLDLCTYTDLKVLKDRLDHFGITSYRGKYKDIMSGEKKDLLDLRIGDKGVIQIKGDSQECLLKDIKISQFYKNNPAARWVYFHIKFLIIFAKVPSACFGGVSSYSITCIIASSIAHLPKSLKLKTTTIMAKIKQYVSQRVKESGYNFRLMDPFSGTPTHIGSLANSQMEHRLTFNKILTFIHKSSVELIARKYQVKDRVIFKERKKPVEKDIVVRHIQSLDRTFVIQRCLRITDKETKGKLTRVITTSTHTFKHDDKYYLATEQFSKSASRNTVLLSNYDLEDLKVTAADRADCAFRADIYVLPTKDSEWGSMPPIKTTEGSIFQYEMPCLPAYYYEEKSSFLDGMMENFQCIPREVTALSRTALGALSSDSPLSLLIFIEREISRKFPRVTTKMMHKVWNNCHKTANRIVLEYETLVWDVIATRTAMMKANKVFQTLEIEIGKEKAETVETTIDAYACRCLKYYTSILWAANMSGRDLSLNIGGEESIKDISLMFLK